MNHSQIYILVFIIVLAAIMLIFAKKKMQRPLSKLAIFAFIFVIFGIIFGNDDRLGYGLMGVGVILAVVDIIRRTKDKSKEIK